MYDSIIVGAGSAGAILAARLTEDPEYRVLLLEAGPDYADFVSLPDEIKYGYGTPAGIMAQDHDWGYTGRATAHAPSIAIPRGKVTGGSSAVNAQVFLRGIPEDFEAWVRAGNDRWGFTEVLPYFRKLEADRDFDDAFHGTDGPIAVRRYPQSEWLPDQAAFYEACRSAGFPACADQNHPEATGVGALPLNNLDRVRYSTALGYLAGVRGRRNLTVRAGCMVRRVRFEGARAVGVVVGSAGGEEVIPGGEVVLCGGAIGTPHVLMLSGVGPAKHLEALGIRVVAGLPGVGQNVRDHPATPMVWRTRRRTPPDPGAHWHQVGLRYTAGESDLRNDMIVYVAALPGETRLLMRPTVNLTVGAGEVRLRSADPDVQPEVMFRFFEAGFDRQRVREGIRLCARLAGDAAFEPVVEGRLEPPDGALATDAALDAWMLRNAATGHHISCTCRMGPAGDPAAVVDQYGRVYGLEALRVADASVMPDCVRANINATVMMVAERMADFIREG